MEITLEKVELVKDRTGVSYKEAKEALEAADGNVVDAIVGIEETINLSTKSKINDQTKQVIDKIKDAVEKGNVSRIRVKKDDDVVLNLPVNIGILGAVLAPIAAVIGTVAAFGTKCTIELVKDDGSIVDLAEKGGDIAESLKEKGGDIAETLKEKGGDLAGTLKEKGGAAFSTVSEKVQDTVSKTFNSDKEDDPGFKDAVDEMWEEAKDRVNKVAEDVEDIKEDIEDAVEDKIDDIKDANSEAADDAGEIKIEIVGDIE